MLTSVIVSVLPLAVVDAVGVGALAMPVWFLLSDRARTGYICIYLTILAAAYATIGVAMLNGPSGIRTIAQEQFGSDAGGWVRGVVGVVLLLIAAWYGLIHNVPVREQGVGWFEKWRDAAIGENATLRGVVGVALLATVVEIPTAVPFAIALGRIDEIDPSVAGQLFAVVTYTVVMIVPALALTIASVMARMHVAGVLYRVDLWFRRNAQENTAWIVAFVGFALFFETQLYNSVMGLISDAAASDG
ncbi:MAG: GAP family protein [Rhodococcus sp. (in: high G+C Gram-positive bacteria)]